MKRFLMFPIVAILLIGTVSAQAIREERNPAPKPPNEREREVSPVKVEGVLTLEKGFVAVEDSGNVYVIPTLNRYIGFINGLKEGAKVSVEGFKFNNMIRPSKVTIEGKAYDFPVRGNGPAPGFENRDFRPNLDKNQRPSPRRDDRDFRNGRNGGCCR